MMVVRKIDGLPAVVEVGTVWLVVLERMMVVVVELVVGTEMRKNKEKFVEIL